MFHGFRKIPTNNIPHSKRLHAKAFRTRLAALALGVSSALAVPALADQVVLTNGDRITGTIDSADSGKLIITSPIEGKITVDMANVKTFSTDGPIKIVLADGTVINQRISEGNAGTLETASGGSLVPQSIPLSQVSAINPPPIAWTGNIVLNASLSQGDTYSEQLGLSADLLRRGTNDRIELQGDYQFAKQKVNGISTTSLDQWDLEASYNYFLSKKAYVLGDARVEKNRIQKLDLRVTPNVGGGYQFVERPDFNANVEGGVAWVYEDYTNIAAPNENVSLRLAYHIDKTIWSDKLKLFSDAQYFPSMENTSKYIILADAGVRLAITKSIFTEFKGIVNYDSTPAPGSHRTQTQMIWGVGVTF